MIDVFALSPQLAGLQECMRHLGEQPSRSPGLIEALAHPPPRYDPTLDLVAASLAAGMIAAGAKAVTAEEAVAVWREVRAIPVSTHKGDSKESAS